MAARTHLFVTVAAVALTATAGEAQGPTRDVKSGTPSSTSAAQGDSSAARSGRDSPTQQGPAVASQGGSSPGSTIVVTGIRRSLQAAQETKRLASTVVEVITSQDLGKFTDPSISEAIARLPGVSIDRNVRALEGGDTVTIRGLGPDYVTATVNGRELMGNPGFGGAGARRFDFGAIPPEVLSGAVVYKTSAPNRVEPGLGGQVDLQTLRPLDYHTAGRPLFGSVSVDGAYDENARKLEPRLAGLLGGKFFNDTLGVYFSALNSKEQSRRAQYLTYQDPFSFELGDSRGGTTAVTNALVPWGFDFLDVNLANKRQAYSGAVQWKPNRNLEVTADFLRDVFKTDYDANRMYYEVDSVFGLSPSTVVDPSGVVLRGDTNPGVVYYDTKALNAGAGLSTPYMSHLRSRNRNAFYYGGFNAVLRSDDDRTAATLDYVHGVVDFDASWRAPYAAGFGGETVFDNRQSSPKFQLDNPSLRDPSSYTYFGFLEYFEKQGTARRDELKLDLRHALTSQITLRAGARLASTNFKYVSMNFRPSTSATSLQNYFVPGASDQLIFAGQPSLVVDEGGFCGANPQFCNQSNFGRGSFVGSFPTGPEGKAGDIFDLNPGESYHIKERNSALYLQADANLTLFGVPVSGTAGIRAVNIKEVGFGFQGQQEKIGFDTAPVVPGSAHVALVSDQNRYWEYLPSVNLTAKPEANVNLRFGVAKTMSLPDYKALAPSGTATIILPNSIGGQQPNEAIIGNTHLKPTEAWNYDITGEYYTSYGGSFVGSLFYKDVRNLLTGLRLLQQTIPGQGATKFDIFTTVNGATGHSYGFEVGTNQPLSFLPGAWNGLGFQANYTFVQSATTANGRTTTFGGTSKHNVSVTAYYEKYGFTARLAYLFRTKYLEGRVGAFDQYVDQTQFLDGTISYKFKPKLEVILTASNLLGQNQTIRFNHLGNVAYYNELPRSYRFGVRYGF